MDIVNPASSSLKVGVGRRMPLGVCVLRWHGGVVVNRRLTISMMCIAAAFTARTAAYALEEQPMPTQPPAAAEGAKAGVQDAAPSAKPDAGTEIRIPGLGRLGTLPKMDFGLELLYGASEGRPPQEQLPLEEQPDDLTVRGSVKHRF